MIFCGRWVFLWPMGGWGHLDLPHVAADCREIGFDGVILHTGIGVAHEVSGTTDRVAPFVAAGLRVALGIGFPKPSPANLMTIAAGIVAAIRVPGIDGVELDAEGAWDQAGDAADAIADRVLSLVPEAAEWCADVPWWAPRATPDGHGTHPHWPVRQFGRIVSRRFPQCYGAPTVGASTRMLAWARKQYGAEGQWPINACVQGYKRTTADHVALYTAETDTLTWDYLELDASCRAALHAVLALKSRGFAGPDAVAAYQRAAGLTVDDECGPRTLAALGIAT